jgi:hypothetical protein
MFVLGFIKAVVLPVPVVSCLGQSSILSQVKGAGVRDSGGVWEREIFYSMAARVRESRGEGGRGSQGAGARGNKTLGIAN